MLVQQIEVHASVFVISHIRGTWRI